jgi:lysophospholipid acyltransferase (LPLAT)-like uncharacterized protein
MTEKKRTPRKPFTFSQRLQLAVFPIMLADIFKLLYKSCPLEVRGARYKEEVLAEHGRCHMAIWHEAMAVAGCYYGGHDYTTMTSQSYDGEFAARVIKRWRIGAARGSSSRGGSDALSTMYEAAQHARITGFTLDGPQGPRYVAKPGMSVLSARTGLPVVPNIFAFEKAWRLNSWDRFPIQKPFSRIYCVYGEAVPPPADDSPEAIEVARLALESRMNEILADLHREMKLA